MRPIKFRAWDGRQMYKQPKIPYSYINLGIEESGLEIMQYTGLHDKNGVELYEGDIVKTYLSNAEMIEWSEDDARFVLRAPDTPIGWYSYGLEASLKHQEVPMAMRCEVIGNIYENPELVKGSHE